MSVEAISLNEVNHRAIHVLVQEMGLVNTFRFINQFSVGQGNYVEDKRNLYKDETVKSLVQDITNSRNAE
jgi:hypothetical protein